MISKVETHMSDGSTQISSTLTAETASLLAKLHPNMFPSIQSMASQDQPVDGEKITELVHSVLTKSSKYAGFIHLLAQSQYCPAYGRSTKPATGLQRFDF